MPLASNSHSFEGSTILSPISTAIGLSIDKVNFIFVQLLTIVIGTQCRRFLTKQALFHQLIHISLANTSLWFCFGPQMVHMYIQSIVAYLIMRLVPSRSTSSTVVLIWSMLYLSLNHIYRLYNDYGGYTLDITGPLMIQTQKITSLAFSLADNQLSGISSSRKKHSVKYLPALGKYFTYLLFLPQIMTGPHCFYADFDDYVNDRVPQPKLVPVVVLQALGMTAIWSVMQLFMSPLIPYHWVLSDAFAHLSFVRKIMYTTAAFFLVRSKYYFAWTLTEAANLSFGFGYSGTDKSTKLDKFDNAKSFDLLKVEMGENFREVVIGWNTPTHHWLRECMYERMTDRYATICTFAVSAMWHGFYPGYYLFFLSFSIFTVTARKVRHSIRPHFQGHPTVSLFYDIVTRFVTNLSQTYLQGVFFLLEFGMVMKYWSSMYFLGHILAGLMLFTIPSRLDKFIPPWLFTYSQFVPPFILNQYRQYFPGTQS